MRWRLDAARTITNARYEALKSAQAELPRALRCRWPSTVFAFPTSPITAPAAAALQQPEVYDLANSRALSHPMLGSYLDLPGMALPTGADQKGLPTSLLLSTSAGNANAQLAVCRRAARVLGGQQRRDGFGMATVMGGEAKGVASAALPAQGPVP